MTARFDVVLVVPPFASALRPSLGVSLLKAALLRDGIACKIEYASLAFARAIGAETNEGVCEFLSTVLLGEWIFSEAAYGPWDSPERSDYLGRLERRVVEPRRSRILRAKALAPSFVDEVARSIVAHRPRIVGFSTTFQQTCASVAIAARIKALDPEISLCLGGANCEGEMGEALLANFPQFDVVFSGESDRVFPEWVHARLASDGSAPSSNRVRSYVRDEKALAIPLDELPTPDFDDYFDTLARLGFEEALFPGLPIEGSRGCWWGAKHHCRFCGLNGSSMMFRAKSPGRVLEEITSLAERHGIGRFEAVDNILDHRQAGTVFDELARRGAPHRFFYEVKANISADLLTRIARGGVSWIQPGVESLDDECLKRMDKGVSALQNVLLLRNCAEIGIHPLWNLLYRFPGDRAVEYEEMADMLPLLEHLPPPTGAGPIRLDRFSPWYERAEELGFREVRPVTTYAAVHRIEPESLRRIAYYFEGRPEPVDPGDYGARLRAEVDRWNARITRPPVPMLRGLWIDDARVVEDTRSCSRMRHRQLSAAESLVLDAFREIGDVTRKLSEAGERLSDVELVTNAYHSLVEWGFILRHRGRALSLVCMPGLRVLPPDEGSRFPGGWIQHERGAPRRDARPEPCAVESATAGG